MGLCTGMKMESWSTHAQEQMRLPMSMRGCGLRQATDRRHAQFVGAMAQSITQLFNRKDSNGNKIGGSLSMPKLTELFGEDSLDSPIHDPWEILIGSTRENHCLSNGLQHAWSHLQNSFQEVATNEQKRDDIVESRAQKRRILQEWPTAPICDKSTHERTKESQSWWPCGETDWPVRERGLWEMDMGSMEQNQCCLPALTTGSVWIHGGPHISTWFCNLPWTTLPPGSTACWNVLLIYWQANWQIWSQPCVGNTLRQRMESASRELGIHCAADDETT